MAMLVTQICTECGGKVIARGSGAKRHFEHTVDFGTAKYDRSREQNYRPNSHCTADPIRVEMKTLIASY